MAAIVGSSSRGGAVKDVSGAWGKRFAASPASAVQMYEDVMVPRLFDPWAHVLLDAVDVRAGDAVLDVATGPGTVARVAANRGASVTACDFSPAMLDMARSKSPANITYVESPAAPLAVDDRSFDGRDAALTRDLAPLTDDAVHGPVVALIAKAVR
ncbi:MAG TPA: methyltransferase domain-containing protein [Acidimicrobiales bacterium]|nr:methyltransferase domain-containing protein [Acidimicrobiales bacterium]